MKNFFKCLFTAALCALLLTACGDADSVPYHRLKYEVTSDPAVNMFIRFNHPGFKEPFGTGGAQFVQDCGYVPAGFNASIQAEAIPIPGLDWDYNITLRIYEDDVCTAQTSGIGSAQLSHTVGSK